jgi:hypothetical protein
VTVAKNYVYRMDHDTGFAPHLGDNICSVSGCKRNTVESWATEGSWVIGIGGKKTGKPDKLIYAMKVKENLSYDEFKKEYVKDGGYLDKRHAGPRVLVSNEFYYLGDNAIDLPSYSSHIIIRGQGCKGVFDLDIGELENYLKSKGYRYGKWEEPDNMKNLSADQKCEKWPKCSSVCKESIS